MITVKQLERAIEIISLRDDALNRVISKENSATGYGGNTFPNLKSKWLHDAEISQMAADRIDAYLKKYLKSLI